MKTMIEHVVFSSKVWFQRIPLLAGMNETFNCKYL
jgi:hypothetical protein